MKDVYKWMSSTPRQAESLNICQGWAKPRDMTWLSLPILKEPKGTRCMHMAKRINYTIFDNGHQQAVSASCHLAQLWPPSQPALAEGHKCLDRLKALPCLQLVLIPFQCSQWQDHEKPSFLVSGFYFDKCWQLTMEENTMVIFFSPLVALFLKEQCNFQCNWEYMKTRKMRCQR